MAKPSLQDWLWVEVMLVQSMIGAISQNFRQVALCYKNNQWIVRVTLDVLNDEDNEEIGEIVEEFAIMIGDIKDKISKSAYVRVESEILIEDGPLVFSQNEYQRIIYRRKEPLELYEVDL